MIRLCGRNVVGFGGFFDDAVSRVRQEEALLHAPAEAAEWAKEHKLPIAAVATVVVSGILYAVLR